MSRFKCCKCGKSIMGDDEWEEHIRNHLNNDDFVCHKCGMDFPSLTELIEHNRVHRPSCSKHWDLKSENNDREKKNLRGKDGVSRKLKFDKPTVLHDLRNRNENMPEFMEQVDELKLQASLIFNNEIKRKGMKKLNYPILNSRCAKRGAQLLSKWKKYLDDEKNEFVNYPGITKYEKASVSSGGNDDYLYFPIDFTEEELLKQKEEFLFYSKHHLKDQGVGDDVIKAETLDEEGGAFVRMFHKYLESEKQNEQEKENEEEKDDDTEETDVIKIVLDEDEDEFDEMWWL
ncbi:Zinc finger protein [Trichinella papuae]|uniref:Zinc finger protein n=1 Tax=Trichinella papuae TaxID=268474 RepID=A0A0V1M8P8_9BILA|nr:Zinc finger protein [Trichinella papuae]